MTTTLDNKTRGTGSPKKARTAGAPDQPKAVTPEVLRAERLATAALIEAARIDAEALILGHWKANEHTMSLHAPFRLEMSREVRLAAAFLEVRATASSLLAERDRGRSINLEALEAARKIVESGESLSATNAEIKSMAHALLALANAPAAPDDAEEQVRVIAGTQSNPKPEGG